MKKKRFLLLGALMGFLLAGCNFDFSIVGSDGIHILPVNTSTEPSVVYATSISAPSSIVVAVGSSRTLTPTFSPSNVTDRSISYSVADSSVASVTSSGVVTGLKAGSTTVTMTHAVSGRATLTATTQVVVTGEAPRDGLVQMRYTYGDINENSIYSTDMAPSLGEANFLVIPVWLTDSSRYIASSYRNNVLSDIRASFFGTPSETGWHSVKSFYETESYGALTIGGTVSSWYECGLSTAYVATMSGEATAELFETAANWYFASNPTKKRIDFDGDGNGFIDGVILVYGAPDYVELSRNSYDNLWAYCSWLQDPDKRDVANPGVNAGIWASYDFMYSKSTSRERTGTFTAYGHGDTRHCKIDAHTYIHESGHLFGLDDYYDYGSNSYAPAAGFSMQDHNVGGHDPYSALALGWVKPYIPTKTSSLTLHPFQDTHELILLTPQWNEFDSPFDEYLLLELYTPTGLNEFDSRYAPLGDCRGPMITGIRVWHVDARLAVCNDVKDNEPVLSLKDLTCDPTVDCMFGVTHAFTNSVNSPDYSGLNDDYPLLKLIRNSTTEGLHTTELLKGSDLFQNGSSFAMSTFSKQFANRTTLNNGKVLGWSFSVSISGEGSEAVAEIELVKG